MTQLQKFQYFLSKFSDTIYPKFNIKINSNDKKKFETSFSGGLGNGGPIRVMTYDKNTKLFSTADYRYYGYSYLPQPFDQTEKYEIKKLDHYYDGDVVIHQLCESEYYMYVLALCTGANINLCLLSDYLFCLENNLECKYIDKMQEICDKIIVLHNYKLVFQFIPTKYRSKMIYENAISLAIDNEEIIQSIPTDYFDEQIADTIMHKTKINSGRNVVGKDKYDKYIQFIPVQFHDFIYNRYKRYLYSTEEKGLQIVKKHYELFRNMPSWDTVIDKLHSKNIDTSNIDDRTARLIYSVLTLPYDDNDSDVQILLNDYLADLK